MLDELMDFKYQKHQESNANTLWGKIIKYSRSEEHTSELQSPC